jgi:hypothetical protein
MRKRCTGSIETIDVFVRNWGMNVTPPGSPNIRLVHRPLGASPITGPLVGWGPKLGSI